MSHKNKFEHPYPGGIPLPMLHLLGKIQRHETLQAQAKNDPIHANSYTITVDQLVTRERETARMRLATAADILAVAGDAGQGNGHVKRTLDRWNLITFEVLDPHDEVIHSHSHTLTSDGWRSRVYLLGFDTWTEGNLMCTTSATCIDLERGIMLTSSGSRYALQGPRSDELHPRLLRHLCQTFNGWGLGARFGIPNRFD